MRRKTWNGDVEWTSGEGDLWIDVSHHHGPSDDRQRNAATQQAATTPVSGGPDHADKNGITATEVASAIVAPADLVGTTASNQVPVPAESNQALDWAEDAESFGSTSPSSVFGNPTARDFAVWAAWDGGQWYLDDTQWRVDNTGTSYDLNVSEVWRDYSGRGVTVAVYDNGVQGDHPEFNGRFVDWDAALGLNGLRGGAPDTGTVAGDNHGTAVAGIIAAGNDWRGAVGVAFGAAIASVDLWDQVPVLDANGNFVLNPDGSIQDMNTRDDANITAFRENFDIVNQSINWGYFTDWANAATTPLPYQNLELAADTGRGGLGTIIVTAAGNDRAGGWDTNASNLLNDRFSVVVGGVQQDGTVSARSNPGANLLVSAFDSNIQTTDRTGAAGYNNAATGSDYTSFGGTSAAAPMVSGIVALMLEANPNLGWRDVQTILAYSARPVGSAVGIAAPNEDYGWTTNRADNWNGGGQLFSNDYGFGLVDAHAAVRLAENWGASSTSVNERSPGANILPLNPTPAAPWDTIPDNGSYVRTFNIPGNVNVETIELSLRIWHPRISDVIVNLTSPEGTTITLLNRPGLAAGAGALDADNTAPGWTLTANGFRGEMSQGTWTMTIQDAAGGQVGTITSADLVTYGSAPTANDNYIYTDAYATVNRASGMSRTVLADTDGGIDTINAAAVSTQVEIDLNPGRISYVAGSYVQLGNDTHIEQAFGGDGNDRIVGNDLINQLRGNRGNDYLAGGGEHDFLLGGAGDDVLQGDAANDILDGGDGYDFASYQGALQRVTVNLADRTQNTGEAQGDIFNDIEGVIGSSFSDDLFGDANANDLWGGAGDVMDYLNGGAGVDTMHGGGGWDRYAVDNSADVIEELVDQGYDTVDSTATLFQLSDNVEALEYWGDATAAFHGIGNGQNNTISGLVGDDILEGRAGNDTLIGYHPWIATGALFSGADTLDGGEGDDTLTGGDDADTFKFADGWGLDTITDFSVAEGDRLDLTGVTRPITITEVDVPVLDWMANTTMVRSARIADDAGNSIVLTGVAQASLTAANFLSSAPILPQNFDGTAFWGGTIQGGAAPDTVTYATATSPIYVDLVREGGYAEGLVAGSKQMAHLVSIENVTGATGYMNYLHGNHEDNVLTGGDSFDWLTGRGGSNTLDGRGGLDLADYYETDQPVTIDLSIGKAFHATGTDTLISVEQFRATNSADTFIGDDQDNYFHGMNGNDVAHGGGGRDELIGSGDDDTLYGEEGDDTLAGESGRDVLDGGAGFDTASYAISSAGVTVNLVSGLGSGGDAEGDQLRNVERVVGSASGDNIVGSARDEMLEGGDGADWLTSGGGADTLLGGAGDDYLIVTDAIARVDGGTGWDAVLADESTDATGFHFTVLGTNVEMVSGRYGNDVIDARGLGYEITVAGYSGDDTVLGGNGGVAFLAGDGNDTFLGGAGFDQVLGGEGNDVLHGGSLSGPYGDRLYGEGGDDVLTATGNGFALGGTGNDTIFGADGDLLRGDEGDDTITGGAGVQQIIGGTGNDILTGGAGRDRFDVQAGWGHDVITDFQVGEDTLGLHDVEGLTSFSQLTITDTAQGALISFQSDDFLLRGVSATSVTADLFLI